MPKGLFRCRLSGICYAMISQNRSISNNERPYKAIDYAIPSKKGGISSGIRVRAY